MASLAEMRMEEPEETATEPQARPDELRILEALLFAASEPLDQAALAKRMPEGVDVKAALAQLQAEYATRGVNLVRVANKWTFRTAGDLAWLMARESTETRKLSRAAIEVLAIVAYHQPVTRAEIEEIRGVVTSKGTLDVLLETGWIKPRGRRKTPGRPLTFGTTDAFLTQFSLETLGDLPGLEELKGTGLLDSRLPTGFTVPSPSDDPTLREDEEPLDAGDLDLALAPRAEPEEDEAHPESKTSENDSSQSHTSEDGTAEREPLANEAAASVVGESDTAETASAETSSAEASSAEYLESDGHQPDTSSRDEAEHPEAGQSDHGGAEDADKDDNGETD
ncbi:MAG: segregation and condensation protein [Bradyrhizobium sp.]|jgi:segregation and condensation protein B